MSLTPAPEPTALEQLRTFIVEEYPGGIHIADHLLDGPHWLLTVDWALSGHDPSPVARQILATWPSITIPIALRYTARSRQVVEVPHFAGQILAGDSGVVIAQAHPRPFTALDWACAIIHAMTGIDSGAYSPLVTGEDGKHSRRPGPLVRAIDELGLTNVAAILTELGPEQFCDRDEHGTPLGYNDRIEARLAALFEGLLHTAAA